MEHLDESQRRTENMLQGIHAPGSSYRSRRGELIRIGFVRGGFGRGRCQTATHEFLQGGPDRAPGGRRRVDRLCQPAQRAVQELRGEASDAALAKTGAGNPDRWKRIRRQLESIREDLLEEDLVALSRKDSFRDAFAELDRAVATALENAEPMTRQQNPRVQSVLDVVGIQARTIADRVSRIAVECRNRSSQSLKTISGCLQSIFSRIENRGRVGPLERLDERFVGSVEQRGNCPSGERQRRPVERECPYPHAVITEAMDGCR